MNNKKFVINPYDIGFDMDNHPFFHGLSLVVLRYTDVVRWRWDESVKRGLFNLSQKYE